MQDENLKRSLKILQAQLDEVTGHSKRNSTLIAWLIPPITIALFFLTMKYFPLFVEWFGLYDHY